MSLPQTSTARRSATLIACLLLGCAGTTASFGQTGGGNSVCARTTNAGAKPGAKENKYYVPGIGNVLVVDLVTGERDELISVVQK